MKVIPCLWRCVSLSSRQSHTGAPRLFETLLLERVFHRCSAWLMLWDEGDWIILADSWELTATGCRICFKNTVLEGSGHYTWVKIQNILKLQNNPISLMITYSQSCISASSGISEDCLSEMFLLKGKVEDLKVDNVFFLAIFSFHFFFKKLTIYFFINIKSANSLI